MGGNPHSECGGGFKTWNAPMKNGNRSLGDRQDHMTKEIDEELDMHAMLEEAFQEIDEAPTHPPTLEEQIEDIVMGAFTVVDKLANEEVPHADDEPLEDNGGNIAKKNNYGDPHVLEETIEELYHGAKSSILAATILMMTLCTIHGVSNKFVDHLSTLFREHLLPSENMLPKNLYAAKILIQKL